MCWWLGVRILCTCALAEVATAAVAEIGAAPEFAWDIFSCGAVCAVAIAAACCAYAGWMSQGSRRRKYVPKAFKNESSNSTCRCRCSCGFSSSYPVNLANGKREEQDGEPQQGEASMMEQLVPEITTHALSYLDFPSLCRLSMTNSSMRRAANDDNAWKALYHKDFTIEQDSVSPPNGWKSYYAATKAVKDVNADYYRILKAKNIGDMSRFWLKADYVKCIHPGGRILTGYDAVIESFEPPAFNWNQRYDCQLRDVRVRVLGDMAWVTLKEYVNAASEPFLVTNIYEVHNGQWLMVHHHSSLAVEAGAADRGMFGG
uniref:F-box domain-containing protein n=1 Tax=Araucaria cunninghamii TaxID=56994 RepID=A0A0D6R7S7_ARACU